MHPELERQLAATRADDAGRRAAQARLETATQDGDVVIRAARRDDTAAVAALAVLDDKLPPVGGALVAEVDGELAAVLPLGGGTPIADPFRRTAHLIALLVARADHLDRERRERRDRRRLGWHPAELLRRLV
jgi:hypothetical protein